MKHYVIASLTLLSIMCGVVAAPASAAGEPITLYDDQYAGDMALDNIVKILVEKNYDIPVQIKQASVGIAFLGTARDKRSLFLAAWLPKTHAEYMNRVRGQVENLGTSYSGARLGWVVPAYVPKDQLNSFTDLKKSAVADRLGDKIQGISAGAGEMIVSKKALKTYGLSDYRLTTASGAAMTAALARAIDNKQWIVVTGWSPHWMWKRFNLRYLKDPKKAMGSAEHVDAIANPALKDEAPRVHGLVSRMHLSVEQVNQILVDAEKTSYPAAARKFIQNHPKRVQSWVNGSES